MNDDLDALLHDDLLRPPPDFTQRVMQRIQPLAFAAPQVRASARAATRRWHRLRRLATTLGLVGSSVLGLSQLASYVFGLWLASAAI
ncbi:hypothetical protein [Rhodoferax ferrireducens]|uniref:hypothetical protein n=1 Tax=Rhodoferax ferrireducens TaxID=192843 RepID=UPI000E0DA2BC|nr:hypothetical protein [Rhodoferax ferrireducens]